MERAHHCTTFLLFDRLPVSLFSSCRPPCPPLPCLGCSGRDSPVQPLRHWGGDQRSHSQGQKADQYILTGRIDFCSTINVKPKFIKKLPVCCGLNNLSIVYRTSYQLLPTVRRIRDVWIRIPLSNLIQSGTGSGFNFDGS